MIGKGESSRYFFVVYFIALNVTHTLARFQTPSAAKFNSGALWKGTPEVRFNNNNNWFAICADSRWNIEVARAVCYHRGFSGVMLVDTTSLNQPIRHASCVPDYSSSPPLSCQENTTNTCSQVPRVSCFLPGYTGCYRSTDDNPYFTITPPQQFDQTLQDCGRDCYSLGHQFFGVTGSRCHCSDSNEPSEGEELGMIACQTRCQGDPDQICGGTNAVSVYEASLGECYLYRTIEDGGMVHFTSLNFPAKYPPDYSCEYDLTVNLNDTDLQIVINYDLDVSDQLQFLSAFTNKTLIGGTGLETIFIPNFETHSINLIFRSEYQSTRGYFVIYFYSEFIPFTTDYGTPEEFTTPQQQTSETMATVTVIPPTNNVGLYIGVGVAGVIVVLLFIALLSVLITARRNRSKPAAAGHVDVTSSTNVAYNMDSERVTVKTGDTPGTHSNDDTHRYATIEGNYYYATTNGPQPPLPKPRDANSPANQEAEYEELPDQGSGTPYQSLTKNDIQAYQELRKNQAPSHTTLEPPANNEYLEPI
ncbi:uncharacterized protein LOC121430534 [Lytechinus variegatus]|uniref:uncharacterized protein LOC121430534 n=1 Tax=Lytechinus variegatus TaxID=7654 RepID=UPI001BB14792|nr:uncharacterized protein LOC121430534 [Lytechinus variegatus]